MINIFKIGIIGNSVALRNRPAEAIPYNKNYGALLQQSLQNEVPDSVVEVKNMALGRATILDIEKNIDNIINYFPDIFIINIGVVGASTREIPLWYSDAIQRNSKNIFSYQMAALHHFVMKKNRSLFVKLRGKRTWISEKVFEKKYQWLVEFIRKETNASIIAITINSGNNRLEAAIPGSRKNYSSYNKIISEIAEKNNFPVIDVSDLISEKHFPDGVHYNSAGHKIVAQRLLSLVKKILEERKAV
ncbi:MAG: GDSL-type esterase/lipase family protein [Bacteroidota bacterium]|nr:GDSL-type esterase/lipase family protein [Bacteroidota bacterium]